MLIIIVFVIDVIKTRGIFVSNSIKIFGPHHNYHYDYALIIMVITKIIPPAKGKWEEESS